jgi:hypothetical protein
MKKSNVFLPAIGTALLVMSSCNRMTENNTPSAVTETIVQRELAVMESETISEEMAERGSFLEMACFNGPFLGAGALNMLPECAEVLDSGEASDPRVITIGFEDGCTGSNGMPLGGSLEIELIGADGVWAVGDQRTVTHVDFQRGPRIMNGTRARTLVSLDAAEQPSFERVHDMTFEHAWGVVTQAATGSTQWLAGFETPGDCTDDVWVRNTEATWTGPQGNGTSRTATDLTWDGACGYLVSGTVVINRPFHNVTIDFGDGTCDALATVEHNGSQYELNLETHELTPL